MRKYEIGIGIGYDRHGKSIKGSDAQAAKKQADDLLVEWFGGFTRKAVNGAWRNDQGEVVRERGLTYVIHTSEPHGAIDYAADCIGRLFDQQAVVITYPDNSSRFHEGDYFVEDTPLDDGVVPLEDVLAD